MTKEIEESHYEYIPVSLNVANREQLKTIGPGYGVKKRLFETYESYRERIIKVMKEGQQQRENDHIGVIPKDQLIEMMAENESEYIYNILENLSAEIIRYAERGETEMEFPDYGKYDKEICRRLKEAGYEMDIAVRANLVNVVKWG